MRECKKACRKHKPPKRIRYFCQLLTMDFNKVEWIQLGGLHVEHSCSPLNNGLGASTGAPFLLRQSLLVDPALLLIMRSLLSVFAEIRE